MKNSTFFVAVWLLALAAGAGVTSVARAQLVQRHSTAFNQLGTEGDSLPAPATIVSDLGFTLDGTGNYLFDSSINGHIGHTGGFSDATGWTIEARVKVDMPNVNPIVLVGQISAGDDTLGYYQVNIATTRIYGVAVLDVDMTQWTTIRMAKAPLAEAVTVWLNDVEVPGGPFPPTGAGLQRNWQVIGDGTGATGGSLIIDYLRSDTTGAYAPGAALVPGDFDGNGAVNGTDLAIWRTGYGSGPGTTTQQGDASGDGNIDGADYLIWQRNHTPGAAVGAAAGVPEPTASCLFAIAAALVVGWNRRHQPNPRLPSCSSLVHPSAS